MPSERLPVGRTERERARESERERERERAKLLNLLVVANWRKTTFCKKRYRVDKKKFQFAFSALSILPRTEIFL